MKGPLLQRKSWLRLWYITGKFISYDAFHMPGLYKVWRLLDPEMMSRVTFAIGTNCTAEFNFLHHFVLSCDNTDGF